MESVKNVAAYIARHYVDLFGEPIDQMKLHKLLYFAQRESFILYDKPLFKGFFHAGKYGPIVIEIRDLYRDNELLDIPNPSNDYLQQNAKIFERIWDYYAKKSSHSLSILSHGEISWKNAYEKMPDCHSPYIRMKNKDIQLDATRIRRLRRFFRVKH